MAVSKRKSAKVSIGGLPFFLSLGCLLYLSLANSVHLLALLDPELRPPDAASLSRNWFFFLSGCCIGAWFAYIFINGRHSVFIHEFKHQFVSGLAGNKDKGFKIGRDSGHFKYAYSHQTEKYNSFISLAPYWLPLFTCCAALISACVYQHGWHIVLLIIGAGYGCDLLLNLRDISPIQTDLTDITGGYKIGVLFVAAMNITIFTILAAWVSDGFTGLQVLLAGHWNFMIKIVAYYRGLQLAG